MRQLAQRVQSLSHQPLGLMLLRLEVPQSTEGRLQDGDFIDGLAHGTGVVIEKVDRLIKKTTAALQTHLVQTFSVTCGAQTFDLLSSGCFTPPPGSPGGMSAACTAGFRPRTPSACAA